MRLEVKFSPLGSAVGNPHLDEDGGTSYRAEMAAQTSPHRPLRLILDSRPIDNEVHSIAADTGIGCSTLYAHAGLRLGIDPAPLNISRGAGCSRQVLPRHGPVKEHLGRDQLPETLVLQSRLSLHGEGRSRGPSKKTATKSAASSSAATFAFVDRR